MFTENANRIFNRSIEEYHRWDDVDHPIDNPYAPGTIDHLLYLSMGWSTSSQR